jgi:hypothetical protein
VRDGFLLFILCAAIFLLILCVVIFFYSYFEKLVDEIDIDSIVKDFASRNFQRILRYYVNIVIFI